MPRIKKAQERYTYSVLMYEDMLGFGYVAQPTRCNHEAMNDGWILVTDGLTMTEACALRDDLKLGDYTLEEVIAS